MSNDFATQMAKLEEEISRLPRVSGDTSAAQGIHVTQRLNKLLVHAQDEAKKLKDAIWIPSDRAALEKLISALTPFAKETP